MAAGIEGLGQLVRQLEARRPKGKARSAVTVGFSAPHALVVHEDLTAQHTTGMAKFLETPMRQHEADMARIVREGVLAGQTLEDAEFAAAQFLLARAKELVPVDTGALRDSGFVTRGEVS